MEIIGAYEAKTHLPRLLERVARGERIIITKHGVPVAVLQPPASQSKIAPKEAIADLRKFREKNKLQGLSIREMITELPIVIEQEEPERMLKEILALARKHSLSIYDASYLDLAMRKGISLSTLDKDLVAAAKRSRVPLVKAGQING